MPARSLFYHEPGRCEVRRRSVATVKAIDPAPSVLVLSSRLTFCRLREAYGAQQSQCRPERRIRWFCPVTGLQPNNGFCLPFFRPRPASIEGGRLAPIIPHTLRNCGSLPPKSLTRLRWRCVAYHAGVVDVEPFREIRPALFAGVVAGASLAAMTDLRAQAAAARSAQWADSCLTAPKGATPAGSHWYYRIDRVTKRQCWYLREESDTADDKFARAAPPASAPSAAEEPVAPQQRTITRKSIADARAEWVSQQPRAEPAKVERTVAAVPAPAVPNSPRAAMPNVLAPAPLSSMRWNDAPTATRTSLNSADLQVAAANPPAAQRRRPNRRKADQVQQPAVDQVARRRTRRRQSRPHRCRSCSW